MSVTRIGGWDFDGMVTVKMGERDGWVRLKNSLIVTI